MKKQIRKRTIFACLLAAPLVMFGAGQAWAEICPTVYDPVCGVDGQTYGNDCEAGNAGVSIAYNGECLGCDGVTGVARNNSTLDAFPTVQEAVDDPNANDYDTIQTTGALFDEDVWYDRDIILTVSGGYTCDFSDNPATSSINSLAISNGAVALENIVLRSKCDSSDVTLCINSVDCNDAGGYWSVDTCIGIVTSANGRIWMDRNLGASRVATSDTDELAFGDLYQWGRGADGHQLRTSGITFTASTTDDPGHDDFILAHSSPYDWRVPQNDNLWQGVSGINNPCPAGFRLPTMSEWQDEQSSWSSRGSAGAFGSPLKLVMAGYREDYYGFWVSDYGMYWGSSTDGYEDASALGYVSGGGNPAYYERALGFSVRCIMD